MSMKIKHISVVLIVVFVINLFAMPINAENVQNENAKHLINGLVPKDSMYYNNHTYLAFTGSFNWYQAKDLCKSMGGYLVTLDTYEEQIAVMGLSDLGWTGACAFSDGYTRTWGWDHPGPSIGIMHEPVPGIEDDVFYYTPLNNNIWDESSNEPNSWITPWDQNVATLNKNGLNTLRPSDTDGFICEFDSPLVFSVVDLNFDMNFNFELDWGYNKVWGESPSNYISGLPQSLWTTFGKTIFTPEYPNNAQEHYNFRGYSINKNTTPIWLNSPSALHTDGSKCYIGETVLDKPVVTLYAVWEKAESTPSDLECFAASMFAYAKKLEKGKTVTETLNLQENLTWIDIDNDLPLFKGNGHVTMRDFMNAVIGGYIVDDFVRYDEGSTFSAVHLVNANGNSIIAYRGTEHKMLESINTDYLMGSGVLNVQFGHAINFYNKHAQENPIITGHSLGGALAAHVGILRDVPCCTINSAQGFSIPITLIWRHGGVSEANESFSFTSNLLRNFINDYYDKEIIPDTASFDEECAIVLSKYGFYDYQPKLRSYAHIWDDVSKPNRSNMVVDIFTSGWVDPLTAHNIDRMVFYDENTNRFSIAPTTRQFPKVATNQNGVVPSAWAYDGYTEAENKDLITPELDQNYQGETNRAEFCRAVVNFTEKYYNKSIMTVLKERNLSPIIFADTDDEAISVAAALGITSGTDMAKKIFSPDAIITREQAATMLENTLKALGANLHAQPTMWSDAKSISLWALDSVNAIYNTGIMKGTSSTTQTFSPKSPFTHEQTIVTLNGLWNYLKK